MSVLTRPAMTVSSQMSPSPIPVVSVLVTAALTAPISSGRADAPSPSPSVTKATPAAFLSERDKFAQHALQNTCLKKPLLPNLSVPARCVLLRPKAHSARANGCWVDGSINVVSAKDTALNQLRPKNDLQAPRIPIPKRARAVVPRSIDNLEGKQNHLYRPCLSE